MPKMAVPFLGGEAVRLLRRRVRLIVRIGSFAPGLMGVVVDYHKYQTGYVVEVRWEYPGIPITIGFEYFTKDDYYDFLEEC